MKLFYSASSPYSRKVRMVISLKALESTVDMRLTDPFTADTELAAVNPLGKVPALQLDDGSSLFDSRLLCRYLDSLHESWRLIPRQSEQAWRVWRWEALADGLIDASYHLVMERRRPVAQQSQEWLGRWAKEIERTLEQLDAEIEQFGSSITLAHLALGAAVGYLDFRLPELLYGSECPQPSCAPRLMQWYERFKTQPYMQATRPDWMPEEGAI